MQEASAPIDPGVSPEIPGLKLIIPTDEEALLTLAENIKDVPELWDDFSKLAPTASFLNTYAGPGNMAFDIGPGAGVIVFMGIKRGFRAKVAVALWNPRLLVGLPYKTSQLFRAAAMAAFLANNLIAAEAYINESNKLSRRIAAKCGMTYRGLIRRGGCYNGEVVNMAWYETTREMLDLPPVKDLE